MKKSFITVLIVFLFSGNLFSQSLSEVSIQTKTIQVKINKNIEFIGFLIHMGWLGPELEAKTSSVKVGGKKIDEKKWRAYGYNTYLQHKKYSKSPNLSELAAIGSRLDYSPVVKLALLVDEFPNARLNNSIPQNLLARYSSDGDTVKGKILAAQVLEKLNNFYVEVGFENYMKETTRYYQKMLNQVNEAKMKDNFIPMMETFYKQKFKEYVLIPSLLLPTTMGFGPKLGVGENAVIYNIFGPLEGQVLNADSLDLGFSNRQLLMELSIHEFGHSFVNHVVNSVPDSLLKKTEYLFKKVRKDMADQGYHNWRTCITEHFVRAGEIVILRLSGMAESADLLLNRYITDRQFIYLPFIIKELENYGNGKFATYQDVAVSILDRMSTEYPKK